MLIFNSVKASNFFLAEESKKGEEKNRVFFYLVSRVAYVLTPRKRKKVQGEKKIA
jgi:hypothetical protein